MQWLAIARLVISLWPILKDIVLKIEEAFPQSGLGTSTKLPAAMAVVEQVVGAMGDVGTTFEAAAPAIKTAISGIVTLSKAVGSTGTQSQAQGS